MSRYVHQSARKVKSFCTHAATPTPPVRWTSSKPFKRQSSNEATRPRSQQSKESSAAFKRRSKESEDRIQQRFQERTNPGLGIEDFQALFRKPTQEKRKLYPFRWDWHLRMFLLTLVPPGTLWFFTEYVDRYIATDPDVIRVMQDSRQMSDKKDEKNDEQKSWSDLLEKRIATLEAQIADLKTKREESVKAEAIQAETGKKMPPGYSAKQNGAAEDLLEQARQISTKIVRPPVAES